MLDLDLRFESEKFFIWVYRFGFFTPPRLTKPIIIIFFSTLLLHLQQLLSSDFHLQLLSIGLRNRQGMVSFFPRLNRDSDMSNVSTASQPIGGSKANVFWGWFFLLCGSVSFLGFLFAPIISKLIPLSGNRIISAIQNDRYYCFLVPLTLPVLVVAVYFHWLGMKLFKHA